MIENGTNVIKTAFERATGTGEYIILYLVALIFAYAFMKEKNNKSLIVNYAIISILVIFNPIVAYFLDKFLTSGVYWRLFWSIPLGISIAYMFTEVIFLSNSRIKRTVLTISAILVIIYSGTIIYKQEVFQKVNNWFKIPDDELLAINIILNEKEENPKIFVPTEMVAHVRQIDSSVRLIYERFADGDYSKINILNFLKEKQYEAAIKQLKTMNCNFIVWYRNEDLEKNSYLELIGCTTNYKIYRIK